MQGFTCTTKNEVLKSAPPRAGSSFFRQMVQPKLRVGSSDDPYERAADSVADRVMQMPVNGNSFFKPASNSIQRCDCHNVEKLQMKGEGGISHDAVPATVESTIRSGGDSLDANTRSFMETAFGYDFGNVQVHNGSLAHQSSADINALAYTNGNHVVFGDGQYQPGTDTGKRLLAHELAHVVQQGNDPVIRRQEKNKTEPKEKGVPIVDSYMFLTAYGQINGGDDIQGIADKDIVQKLGDVYRDKGVCWEGNYVGIELHFGTAPIPADGSAPRKIPPFISAKLSYKEAGGFTTYRYEGSDADPVWYSGFSSNITANWHPNIQTFFTYPLNKKGTLNIHLEMMDIEDDRLLVYDDSIAFIKCGVITGCREDSLATNRWAVIPANGGPVHPASKNQHDDGPRYEIFKENGKDSYFICLDELTRRSVSREGDQL